jgi:hypothetical protein
MARLAVKTCDVCGKPTDNIVGKLHFIPSIPGVTKLNHSQYTHHADVGECCKAKLFKVLKFQSRMSKDEYNKARRNGHRKSFSR